MERKEDQEKQYGDKREGKNDILCYCDVMDSEDNKMNKKYYVVMLWNIFIIPARSFSVC